MEWIQCIFTVGSACTKQPSLFEFFLMPVAVAGAGWLFYFYNRWKYHSANKKTGREIPEIYKSGFWGLRSLFGKAK